MEKVGNGYKVVGDMLIRFDSNGNIKYGFEFFTYRFGVIKLTKFHPLSDKHYKTIVLPKFDEKDLRVSDTMLENIGLFDDFSNIQREIFTNYADGAVQISSNCFEGQNELTLILPSGYSTFIDWGCCDNKTKLKLILPENSSLKCVQRTFNTGLDNAQEHWALVCNKDFNKSFSFGKSIIEEYFVRDARKDEFDFLSVTSKSKDNIISY